MAISCLFCEKDVTNDEPNFRPTQTLYMCKRCGRVQLTEEAVEDFPAERYSLDDKAAISITLRNEWEREGKSSHRNQKLTRADLKLIVSQFRLLDPIEKMDYALDHIEKSSNYVGQTLKVDIKYEYPLYYCKEANELYAVLVLLVHEGFITAEDPPNPHNGCSITAKGYQRLRDIRKPNRALTQCFVAMWFTPEMDNVFTKAIKPAIEFVELGENIPRYHAVKIDNVEHVNDINDEIIAQIRRSRFLVCDLTGYRGGVYFEAGFAYGLGLEVIYTCRKDWTKEEVLTDHSGKQITTLFDSAAREIVVRKEGVHFDLAHRNRIEWEIDKLDEFKTKLENRIKAVIF
jgi:nucleoside 2-deoxyribosyltransferase